MMGAKLTRQPVLRIIWLMAILLLLFNGTGAIYGGLSLIRYPDGSDIGLSMKLLDHTPFSNYYIPGLVLLIVNVLIDMAVLAATLFRVRNYQLFIELQGALLSGWLIVQMILIRTLDKMHLVMGVTGMLLLIAGRLLKPFKKISQ